VPLEHSDTLLSSDKEHERVTSSSHSDKRNAEREARLAAQLRSNLARRKQQQRDRATHDETKSPDIASPTPQLKRKNNEGHRT
jgi:hypothetical protein